MGTYFFYHSPVERKDKPMHHIWKFASVSLGAVLALGMTALPAAAAEPTEAPTELSTELPAAATELSTELPAESTEAPTEPTEVPTESATEAFTPGWETADGKRCYRLADGSYAVGEQVIDGVPYLFGYSGAQRTDWQTVGGKRFYYDPQTGEAVTGWLTYFGTAYYIDPEAGKLTGAQNIDGVQYIFADNGTLLTGSFYYEDVHYYADPGTGMPQEGIYIQNGHVMLTDADGEVLTGWQETDGRRYYIDPMTEYAVCGLFELDGMFYFGTTEGIVTGDYWLDGQHVYFDAATGALETGFYRVDGVTRYFDPVQKCCLAGQWVTDGDVTCYLDADGNALTGLQVLDGVRYCFDADGAMLTGLQTIDGQTYAFDPETGAGITGAFVTEIGTMRFAADGTQIFGWEITDEGRYYTNEYGFVTEGWHYVGNLEYQFDAEGKMLSDGRLYNQFDPMWKEVKFGTADNTSMYSSACGIFSFCNAVFAMNHSEADAVEVAEWAIGIKAFRPGAGGTYREILYNNIEAEYGEKLNFTLNGQIWGKITDTRLTNHLLTGGVAVIHVSGHFMAVTGYDPETGLYHVLESAVSSKRGLEGDSWVSAAKLTSGYTNVDWFVLISPRREDTEYNF